MTNLRHTNLNLLPVLRELLRHVNVTHAARALNMSQPATSEALGRLRSLFHDEILVPRGRTMTLSAFAERLLPRLESTLSQIEELVAPSSFDPATREGALKIAAADNLVLLMGAELVRKVNQMAPRMTLEFSDPGPKSVERLTLGDIDLIISTRFIPNVQNKVLFQDDVVCIFDPQYHKKKSLSAEEFLESDIILYTPPSDYMTLVERYLQISNVTSYRALRVQNFLLIPHLVEGGQNIGLMPRRLAIYLAGRSSFEIAKPPFRFPRPKYIMSWAPAKEHNLENAWLRGLVDQIAEEHLKR